MSRIYLSLIFSIFLGINKIYTLNLGNRWANYILLALIAFGILLDLRIALNRNMRVDVIMEKEYSTYLAILLASLMIWKSKPVLLIIMYVLYYIIKDMAVMYHNDKVAYWIGSKIVKSSVTKVYENKNGDVVIQRGNVNLNLKGNFILTRIQFILQAVEK